MKPKPFCFLCRVRKPSPRKAPWFPIGDRSAGPNVKAMGKFQIQTPEPFWATKPNTARMVRPFGIQFHSRKNLSPGCVCMCVYWGLCIWGAGKEVEICLLFLPHPPLSPLTTFPITPGSDLNKSTWRWGSSKGTITRLPLPSSGCPGSLEGVDGENTEFSSRLQNFLEGTPQIGPIFSAV